jgi:biotin carboxyl carrier protein
VQRVGLLAAKRAVTAAVMSSVVLRRGLSPPSRHRRPLLKTAQLRVICPAAESLPRHDTRGDMVDLRVKSEIAGSVWKIEVAVGDSVGEEDPLIILESMKMEIPLLAPRAGVVKEILVAEGDPIDEGDVAVVLG